MTVGSLLYHAAATPREHKHRRKEKAYGLEDSAGVDHSLGRPKPPATQRISGHGEVTALGEQYQHQLATSYLEDFRAPGGHGGLEERAGTDQGTRAHLLD